MQDQINERTVALSIKGGKLTAQLLAKAMQAFLRQARASPKAKTGKQSVKSLTKQGASISNIEITGDNIGDFKRVARKYNVDFALKKDIAASPPNWIVFFKAKDSRALESAFNEYGKAQLPVKAKKPTIMERIAKLREHIKTQAGPVKNKNLGGHEH